jgi:glycosyltransferase involved in cell wall biosynthesis
MIVHAYYPLGETRVEREALALVKHGYDAVDVICLWARNGPEFETRDGVNIYRLPVKRNKHGGAIAQMLEYITFFILAFLKLTALHKKRKYNAVQIHNLPDFLVFVGLIPKLTGAKIILDIHDLMPEFYAARFNTSLNSWPVRLIDWQEKLSCRFANKVITVTETWRKTLIERGVPADKVAVVMNVADDAIFCRDAVTVHPNGNNDCFNLIYHGTLTQRYGIDLVLRAVNQIRSEIPKIHLKIHGGGEYRQTLMNLAEELGMSDIVNFSNVYVPSAELPNLIASAQVGFVPYRRDIFTDGILPTKLMEYTALGVPAIVARTPAIEAYFDDNMVEYFTSEDVDELAASILKLYRNPNHRARLIKNSDTFNQRYNWHKLGAEYANFVDGLTN